MRQYTIFSMGSIFQLCSTHEHNKLLILSAVCGLQTRRLSINSTHEFRRRVVVTDFSIRSWWQLKRHGKTCQKTIILNVGSQFLLFGIRLMGTTDASSKHMMCSELIKSCNIRSYRNLALFYKQTFSSYLAFSMWFREYNIEKIPVPQSQRLEGLVFFGTSA